MGRKLVSRSSVVKSHPSFRRMSIIIGRLVEKAKKKTKGGYLTYGISKVGAWSINNNFTIVKKAIINNFKGISARRTIEECNDIKEFQLIAKAGSKYREAYHYYDPNGIVVTPIKTYFCSRPAIRGYWSRIFRD